MFSSGWLADRIAFAPGMAALLGGFGDRKAGILDAFRARLEARFHSGPVELEARAFIGIGVVPERS